MVPVETAARWTHAPPELGGRLALARRVDWRFLLPDPNLGRVLCLGPHDETLIRALEAFSRSFTHAPRAGSERDRAPYDIVVLRDPERSTLAAAARLLHPGGRLYVEVRGVLASGGPRGRRRSVPAYRRALEQLGLEDVRASWHWPSCSSAAEIVPLADANTVRLALHRRRSDRGARLRARLATALLRLGLLPFVIPEASLLALRRDREEEPGR